MNEGIRYSKRDKIRQEFSDLVSKGLLPSDIRGDVYQVNTENLFIVQGVTETSSIVGGRSPGDLDVERMYFSYIPYDQEKAINDYYSKHPDHTIPYGDTRGLKYDISSKISFLRRVDSSAFYCERIMLRSERAGPYQQDGIFDNSQRNYLSVVFRHEDHFRYPGRRVLLGYFKKEGIGLSVVYSEEEDRQSLNNIEFTVDGKSVIISHDDLTKIKPIGIIRKSVGQDDYFISVQENIAILRRFRTQILQDSVVMDFTLPGYDELIRMIVDNEVLTDPINTGSEHDRSWKNPQFLYDSLGIDWQRPETK